jgi:hypothetical protein
MLIEQIIEYRSKDQPPVKVEYSIGYGYEVLYFTVFNDEKTNRSLRIYDFTSEVERSFIVKNIVLFLKG